MLRLVTGPFHPTLESALVHDLRSLKTRDPLAGVALVVPSDQLRRSLKRLLALTHGLSLLNVHILSFHQLALHLDRERLLVDGLRQGRARIALVTDVFFEHLLQQLGQRNVPQTEAIRLSQLAPGAWAALWASLRDLKDATVDPAVALRAVDEKQFTPEDREKLKGLFTLYAALQESRAALGVGSPDDLAALVTELVPASPFLRSLTQLCYYGSYDLTQTQLTLLEKAGSNCGGDSLFSTDYASGLWVRSPISGALSLSARRWFGKCSTRVFGGSPFLSQSQMEKYRLKSEMPPASMTSWLWCANKSFRWWKPTAMASARSVW